MSWRSGPVGDGFATVLVSELEDGWTDHSGDGDKNDETLFIMFPIPSNIPPTANANGPYAGVQGVPVSLISTGSTDQDGSIATHLRDFGDGATSTDADPSHPYLSPGSYEVTLTVTDNDGDVDSDTAMVAVERVDTFIDDDGSVFEADAEWLAASGITKGCNPPVNDEFCPTAYVTRGKMAAFLSRALGLTERANDPFTDDDDSIFQADIEKLAYSGITKGCNPAEGNTKFCPDRGVLLPSLTCPGQDSHLYPRREQILGLSRGSDRRRVFPTGTEKHHISKGFLHVRSDGHRDASKGYESCCDTNWAV